MNAYWPQHAGSFRATFVILAANLILGHAIGRVRPIGLARVAAWTLGAISVGGIERLNAHEPAGFRMLAIIGALFYSMKAVVTVEVQMLGGTRLSWWRWLGFAVLWPGMRPGPFTRSRSESLMGAGDLVKTGLVRLAAGAALIGTARLTWLGSGSRLLATVWLLPGLSLVLHFGVFDLLAGAWRWAGVDCRSLFRSPLRSRSLTEFWGSRWNLAFSEMMNLAFYQPLARFAGRRVELVAAFVGSGLLHEMAISVPVGAGYGMPLAYFTLHGLLMILERGLSSAGLPIDLSAGTGRAWTIAWVLIPLRLLFHRPFVAAVIWPLIAMPSVTI